MAAARKNSKNDNGIRWEACSEGVARAEGTRLMKCRKGADHIARSMAQRLGCAVLVQHNTRLGTVAARIEAQRVVRRYRADRPAAKWELELE